MKTRNEDYLIARLHPGSSHGHICLLADGQGGSSNGALAAKTACETAWQLVSNHSFTSLLEGETWTEILSQADRATFATGGFTTLIGLAVETGKVAGASCGDSKAYAAHSVDLSSLDELTHTQHRKPPVGSGCATFTPFTTPLAAGARLLVASDGVWKYCGYESLHTAMLASDPCTASTLLLNAVLHRSNSNLPDDFSVIIAHL